MNFRDSLLVTFLVAASFSLRVAEDCVVGSGSDCVGKPFCCFPSNCYCCASDTAGPNVTMVNQAVSSCVCDENNPGRYRLVIKSGGLVGNLKCGRNMTSPPSGGEGSSPAPTLSQASSLLSVYAALVFSTFLLQTL
ncbi:hypothetical protein BaRGS_00020265 [Batillaria attramentaria]|uniref:Uncharacterized protein n=1 Tax=Batillaria attramentaria TaxID=370345 RepID=A0ABD0KN84_9CAEN